MKLIEFMKIKKRDDAKKRQNEQIKQWHTLNSDYWKKYQRNYQKNYRNKYNQLFASINFNNIKFDDIDNTKMGLIKSSIKKSRILYAIGKLESYKKNRDENDLLSALNVLKVTMNPKRKLKKI